MGTVVVLFLSEVAAADSVSVVTRSRFIDVIAPSFLVNLPEPLNSLHERVDLTTKGFLPPLLITFEEVPSGSTVAAEVSSDGTVASLRSAAAVLLKDTRPKQLYFCDRLLDNDSLPLASVRGLSSGVKIKVADADESACVVC